MTLSGGQLVEPSQNYQKNKQKYFTLLWQANNTSGRSHSPDGSRQIVPILPAWCAHAVNNTTNKNSLFSFCKVTTSSKLRQPTSGSIGVGDTRIDRTSIRIIALLVVTANTLEITYQKWKKELLIYKNKKKVFRTNRDKRHRYNDRYRCKRHCRCTRSRHSDARQSHNMANCHYTKRYCCC